MTPKRTPFAAYLLSYFGVTVAATMLALGGFSYLVVGWLAVELSNTWAERAAQLVQYRTIQYLEAAGAATRIIGGFQKTDVEQGKHLTAQPESSMSLLWSVLRDTPSVEALYIADGEGNLLQVGREPELVTRLITQVPAGAGDPQATRREVSMKRDASFAVQSEKSAEGVADPRSRAWFRDTRAETITFWSDAFVSASSRQPVLAVTFPVLDKVGGITRVIGANVPLERLNRFMIQAQPTLGSMVLLVNRRGEVMANAIGSTSKPVLKEDRVASIADLGVAGLAEAFNELQRGNLSQASVKIAGQSFRAHVKPFGGYDWTTVVLIPDTDSLDQMRNLMVIAMIVIFSVFLVAVIALLRLSRSLSHPLTRLAAQASHIQAFRLEEFKGVHSRIDEVGQLSSALESAVEALKGFKRYVPADIVRQLLSSPEFARVGGHEAELTIMFTDIFGFTAIAERLSPKDLLSQISEYLELMTSVIMKSGGTVDKYIGDAVMAFWGAPAAVEDGPARACRAALECQKQLVVLNQRWAEEGRPQLITGIGINVARVVVGNFGSSDRLNYSLLGDGVNLAARLEKLNRDYQTRILVSASVLPHIEGRFATRLVDSVLMRGRTVPVNVYELQQENTPTN